jgi:ABC-2 type transport system ATP-binding protein
MQEVSALCNRVIVINKGEIVADDQLTNLMKNQEKETVVVVEFEGNVSMQDLRGLTGVKTVEVLGNSQFKILAHTGIDLRPEIFRFAADHKLSLIGLKQEETSLENIFRELTSTQEV